MNKEKAFKPRHIALCVLLFCTGALGGVLVGSNSAVELPITFISPEEAIPAPVDPVVEKCQQFSKKASQVMYDRQYTTEDLVDMSFRHIRAKDSESSTLTLRAFDTPRGVDDDVKREAVVRFGMYQFTDCMVGNVK